MSAYDLSNGNRTDGQPLKPGTAVFKKKKATSGQKSYNGYNYHHVGLYIGDGTVIEAKGTINGVVTSKVSTWNAWGELKGVDYSDGSASTVAVTKEEPVSRLLKRTSPMMRGDDVRALQESLNKLGYSCGAVDGIFGEKTRAAVRDLEAGDVGDLVKVLQGFLICKGYDTGGFDGEFGAATDKAVRSFQTKSGIAVDGIAGKQTFAELCF